MLHFGRAHCASGFFRHRLIVQGTSAPRGLWLILLPLIDVRDTTVIVVPNPPEVVEGDHFEFKQGQAREKLLAAGVEDSDTGLFFNALRQKLLGTDGAFLRCRLIPRLVCMYGTLLVAAYMEKRSGLGVRPRGRRPSFAGIPLSWQSGGTVRRKGHRVALFSPATPGPVTRAAVSRRTVLATSCEFARKLRPSPDNRRDRCKWTSALHQEKEVDCSWCAWGKPRNFPRLREDPRPGHQMAHWRCPAEFSAQSTREATGRLPSRNSKAEECIQHPELAEPVGGHRAIPIEEVSGHFRGDFVELDWASHERSLVAALGHGEPPGQIAAREMEVSGARERCRERRNWAMMLPLLSNELSQVG